MISTLILIFNCIFLSNAAKLMNCAKSDIKFEKVIGLRPDSNLDPGLLLYQNSSHPVTVECLRQCNNNDNCRSFVLFYNTSACFWYSTAIHEGAVNLNLVYDTNSAWFIKSCFPGVDCHKLWVMERVPGAILIGNDTKSLPQKNISRYECESYCLNEKNFHCRSAKYRFIEAKYGPNPSMIGQCTLSDADRHSLPNSYRVSSYEEEYFENQCATSRRDSEEDEEVEFCAYEEYENATLAHADDIYFNQTKDTCQSLCERNQLYNCRGYSLIQASKSKFNDLQCILHSEDSKLFGPKLLKTNRNSVYYERAPCLNITVTCTDSFMTIKYIPTTNFNGRLYMEGYSDSEECYVRGLGKHNLIQLQLSLVSRQCGIIKASGNSNRTLLSANLIIQYNDLIQTQSDRIIRVGCIFGNDSKVVLGTGVTISNVSNKGSAIINSTINGNGTSPLVEMRVIDFNTKQEVSDTQIGQELQLLISIDNGRYDIWASHLIAMTEHNEESIFLLDDRGCPVNLNIFPALQKTVTDKSRNLFGNFQAFKFASSPIVRFSVIVQFCEQECPPVDCGNQIESFGRRKRDTRIETQNGTKIFNVTRQQFETRSSINDMPLEYIMVVRDPKSISDRLVFGDTKRILVAGYDFATNEVCLDYSLVVGLIVTWIIVQVIFVICCLILVKKYKRYYADEYNRQSMEELHKNFGLGFSNLDNRRVHWADHEENF